MRYVIAGYGSVGKSFHDALLARGVNGSDVIGYDSDPRCGGCSHQKFIEALSTTKVVFCCVNTPTLEKRVAPEERYDLSNIAKLLEVLHLAEYAGVVAIRTMISAPDYRLLVETMQTLGARFFLAAYPALLAEVNAAGSAFQPRITLLGIGGEVRADHPLLELPKFITEYFPDTPIMAASPELIFTAAQFVSVYAAIHRTMLQEYNSLWKCLEQESVANTGEWSSFETVCANLEEIGVLPPGPCLCDPKDDKEGVATGYASEDLAAISWLCRMKEITALTLNAADRQVTIRNKSLGGATNG